MRRQTYFLDADIFAACHELRDVVGELVQPLVGAPRVGPSKPVLRRGSSRAASHGDQPDPSFDGLLDSCWSAAAAVDNGLFGCGVCNISDQVARSEHLVGFDVYGKEQADVLANPRRQLGDRCPAWFISGDVRDLSAVGRRAGYLKLGTPYALESLRQAFLTSADALKAVDHFDHVVFAVLDTVAGTPVHNAFARQFPSRSL